jgi:hypothetical protein
MNWTHANSPVRATPSGSRPSIGGADETSWRLYVPLDLDTQARFPWLGALLERVQEFSGFSVIAEAPAENLSFVHFIDPAVSQTQIYLEELRGGSSASVSHWVGEQQVRSAIETQVLRVAASMSVLSKGSKDS